LEQTLTNPADVRPAPAAQASAAERLVANSRWNFLAFSLGVVANVVSIPLVIAAIGLEAFGAAGLLLAMFAPLTLIGTVLGQALVKELSLMLAQGEQLACAQRVTAAIVSATLAGLVAIAVFWALARHLVPRGAGTSGATLRWDLAVLVCGAGWLIQQLVLILQSILAATQNFRLLAIASAAGTVSSAALVVLASRWHPNALGFLLGTGLGYLVLLLMLLWALASHCPRLLVPAPWTLAHVRGMLEFGRWQSATHFVGAVGNQADRYALGVLAPMTVVGQYNVAMRLQEVVHMGLLKMTEVLFPHFSVTASDPIDKRADFLARCSLLFNLLGVIALAPLIPLAGDIVRLWVGAEAAQVAGPLLQTLATAGVLGSGVNVYGYFAMGTGRAPRLAKLGVVHVVVLVVATVVFVAAFGPMAAGTGYLLANLVRLVIVLHWTVDDFRPYLSGRMVLSFALPPLLVGIAVAWLLAYSEVLGASSWITLILAYAAAAVGLGLAATAATALTASGRRILQDTLRAGRLLLARHH
jgi:O-antigen/teichoic acid export membrane protein